ncbi:outer membrane protein OmpK [Shewanella canadensis]|nr:outer membrane protein OmpK [Shewanella canadensis]
MNKILKIAVPAALACFSASSQAEVIVQNNSVGIGYEYMIGDMGDDNPTQQDQEYFRFTNVTVADWGSMIGWLKFENPTDTAEAGVGDGYVTTKAWLKLDYSLGNTPFNAWVQSFTVGNKATFEENLYLGGSYDVNLGPVKGTAGLGAMYAYGSMHEGPNAGASFAGFSGYAAVLQLKMPLSKSLTAKFYYEGQFDRSSEHQSIGYKDYGYQAIACIDYKLPSAMLASLSYKHRENWGGVKAEGGIVFAEVSYSF